MSILFADVRGSTLLSKQMSPTAFRKLINRFYTEATKAVIEEDGLVEKLAGDTSAGRTAAAEPGAEKCRCLEERSKADAAGVGQSPEHGSPAKR